jgi:hypothetical protein
VLIGSVIVALLGSPSAFAQTSCPLPGQKPMQVVHLFFGRSLPGKGEVTERQWDNFTSKVLTPNFPSGFTVYDAKGQWMTGDVVVIRERTKVVIVAVDAGGNVAKSIETVRDAYQKQFHQLSVGVISETSCAAF